MKLVKVLFNDYIVTKEKRKINISSPGSQNIFIPNEKAGVTLQCEFKMSLNGLDIERSNRKNPRLIELL